MAEPIKTKTCRTCKQIKPLPDFYKNRSKKDGHSVDCKICSLAYASRYYRSETGNAKRKKYRQSIKNKIAQKRYRKSEKGKEKRKRYQILYGQSEKGKATQRRYRQSEKGKAIIERKHRKYPEKTKAHQVVSNAIKYGRIPRPSSLQCSCGKPAKHYHHYKGYSKEHWFDVIPVCYKCHNTHTSPSNIGSISS